MKYTKINFGRESGIGNRIKGMVSIWKLLPPSEPLVFNWPITNICSGKFLDIFDIPGIAELNHMDDDSQVVTWRLIVLPTELDVSFGTVRPKPDFPTIDMEYQKIPQHIRDIFLPLFKRVVFVPEIKNKAMDYALPDNAIGVHCREDKGWAAVNRSLPLENYYKVIDSLDNTRPIFLSAHSKEIADKFINKYGNRINMQSNRLFEYETSKGLKEVCSELLILSKCNTLVCDYLSTFCEVAWWLGGCKAEVFTVKK